MVFLTEHRLAFDTILIDAIDKEKCDHAMLDCLYLYELVHIDLVVQPQLCLFVYLTQRAIDGGLPLVDFAFRKIKLSCNPITRVVIDYEEETVESSIEDEGTVGRNL